MPSGLAAIALVTAPFAGSLMALTVERWRTGESIVTVRSLCPSCRHPLGVPDLVPILS